MTASRASYTDDERADALVRLAANGGQLRKTARETGIPEATLRHWRNDDSAAAAREHGALKMRPTAERLDHLAAYLLELIPDRTEKMNGQQLAVAAAVLMDKAAMLRAAATPDEPEQPIDLSKLSPERLETLNAWLNEADGPAGDVGAVPDPLDVPGVAEGTTGACTPPASGAGDARGAAEGPDPDGDS